PTCLNASVVSRTKLISSAVNSRRPNKSLRVQRVVMMGTSIAAAIAESGERTLVACWRWHSAIANFSSKFGMPADQRESNRKFVSAERRNQHAASVRSPETKFGYSFFFQPNSIRFVVCFLQVDLNLLARRSRQIFSNIIWTNRQLAMTAI